MTIDEMVPSVTFALGNRTDVTTNAKEWIRDSYRELGNTVPLETLEDSQEDLMVTGVVEYPYPELARAVKAIYITVNDSIQPIPLVKKDIHYISRYPLNVNGIPSIWAPLNRVAHVRMPPLQSYPLFWKFWTFPVVYPVNSDDTRLIGETPLLVPDDWLEVVKYGAIMRGWTDLQDYVKSQSIHQILFGDPKDPDQPGLIQKKLTQNQAESPISDYATTPKIRSYTSR